MTPTGLKRGGLALMAAAGIIIIAVGFGQDVVALFSDAQRLREAIHNMGAWAPLGLVVLSAVQIVVAPIPGYLVQIAGGYLLGAWQGTIFGVIGMLLGASGAFLLGRRLGVPLLHRLVPDRLLDGWLHLRHLDSLTVWIIVLLLPIGDFCYFLAGLSSLTLPRMLLATLLVRGPTVAVASFVGAQVAFLPEQWLWLLVAAVAMLTVLILWQKERLEIVIFDRIVVRTLQKREELDGKQDEDNSEHGSDDPR